MRIHHLVSICALFFFWGGQCYVQWAQHTDKCVKTAPALGNSEFCCNAFCVDGTIAGNSGECLNYDDPCQDVEGPPSCTGGQTYVNVTRDWVNMDGMCKDTVCGQPQRFSWAWTCCDCPAGYVSFNHGACALYPATYSCVRCSDPNELLTGNAVDGFKCILSLSTSTLKSSTRSSSTSSSHISTSTTRGSSKSSTSTSSKSSTRVSSKSSTPTSSKSSTRASSKSSSLTASKSSTHTSKSSTRTSNSSIRTSSKLSTRASSTSSTRGSSKSSTSAHSKSSTSSKHTSSVSSSRVSSKSSTRVSATTKPTVAGTTGVK